MQAEVNSIVTGTISGNDGRRSSMRALGQATPVTIVYDAETTHGRSDGPVLDIYGSVVAVNTAILPEYGESNLGVLVAKLQAFLKDAGLR